MAALRVGGIANVMIDGTQWTIKGKVKIYPFGTKKTPYIASNKVVGSTRTPTAPGFDMDPTDLGGVSLQQLEALDDSVVTLECDSGKVWILSGAFVIDEPDVDQSEGTANIKFRGTSMIEQTA